MIDEEAFAALLAEHAERIPVPPAAIDTVLAAAFRSEAPRSLPGRFARPTARVLGAAAVVLIAVGAVWTAGARSTSAPPTERADRARPGSTLAPAASPPTNAAARGPVGRAGATPPPDRFSPDAAAGSQGGTTHDTTTRTSANSLAQARLRSLAPNGSALVVRTGTLDLRVERHTFGRTVGQVTTIAAGAGGFVADASTFESATTPSGTVTVRVPAVRFDSAVAKLRALGTVVSATMRGVDVTSRHTDLQARLRAATATRDQYLTVLGRATNIGDILAVQDRIQAVQTQIEQLQGQIGQLDDQAARATITVSITEPAPEAKPVARPAHPSGLSVAWGNARHGFAQRAEGLISRSGSAFVIALALLFLGALLRLFVPRVRRLLV
jgi:hypothetical protein